MKKRLAVIILLLFGCFYTKADVQDLTSNPRAYLPPLSSKLNNSYLSPPTKGHEDQKKTTINKDSKISMNNLSYQHNQPKVIDDPLPMKVDCIQQPLNVDFAGANYKPILKGALISGLFFNLYESQPLKMETANEAPTNSIVNVHGLINETKITDTQVKNAPKSTNRDIKGQSSSESKKYAKSPIGADVIPINYFADAATKYKLFNYDEDIELSGSAPVVIFKSGDDIAFTHDASVIDDYEHKFTEKEFKKAKKSSSITTTSTMKPLPSSGRELNKYQKSAAVKAEASDNSYSRAVAKPSTSTEKSGIESESSHAGHGYVYDKPKIPFTF